MYLSELKNNSKNKNSSLIVNNLSYQTPREKGHISVETIKFLDFLYTSMFTSVCKPLIKHLTCIVSPYEWSTGAAVFFTVSSWSMNIVVSDSSHIGFTHLLTVLKHASS